MMKKQIVFYVSILLIGLVMNSCEESSTNPSGNYELLLKTNFRIDDLEENGLRTNGFFLDYDDSKVELRPYQEYAYLESIEQWEVAPGYLYKLTIELEPVECDDESPVRHYSNYCGLVCNDTKPVWIVTENKDYATRSSFVNAIDGWTCNSEDYCPLYDTYVFEITRNSVKAFAYSSHGRREFVGCGETSIGTVEKIQLSIRSEREGDITGDSIEYKYLKLDRIVLKRELLSE